MDSFLAKVPNPFKSAEPKHDDSPEASRRRTTDASTSPRPGDGSSGRGTGSSSTTTSSGNSKHNSSNDADDEKSLTTVLRTHVDRTNLLLLIADCTDTMRRGIVDAFDPEKVAAESEKPDLVDVAPTASNDAEKGTPRELRPEDSTSSDRVPDDDDDDDEHDSSNNNYNDSLLPHKRPSRDSLKGASDATPDSNSQDVERARAAIAEAEEADLENAAAAKAMMTAEQKQEAARKAAEDRARKEHEVRVKECASQPMLDLRDAALAHFDDWRARVIERVGNAVNQQHGGASHEPEREHHDVPVTTGPGEHTTPEQAEAVSAAVDRPDDDDVNTALHRLYAPQDTLLTKLNAPHRVLVLHSLLLLLLGLEQYSAEARVLLLHVASSLHLPVSALAGDERRVAQGLLEVASKEMSADDETKRAEDKNVFARRWKVGLGAVAGATLIGVTGGLAAPLLAAGIGSVMGGIGLGGTVAAGYLGALAGSAPLVGVLFGAYGGRMTGKMVDQYAKEVSDFAFLPVDPPLTTSRLLPSAAKHDADSRRLRVAIGISGWLTHEDEVIKPWRVLSPAGVEAFALRWELEALLLLGDSISVYVKSAAWGWAKAAVIRHTVFAALTAAMWPLAALKAAKVVDNPFSVAKARSDKAGRVLADALANRVQGERPVTLVGYGLGARIIYACLQTLAERRQFGLVETAVLAGAAAPADAAGWRRARTVVSGRLVNVYSSNDYLLGFLYRSTSVQLGIAGLQAIKDVAGIENVDASDAVDGHLKYRFITGTILRRIGLEDLDLDEVHKQEDELALQSRQDASAETERDNPVDQGKTDDEILAELENDVARRKGEHQSQQVQQKKQQSPQQQQSPPQQQQQQTFLDRVGRGMGDAGKTVTSSLGSLKLGGQAQPASQAGHNGKSSDQGDHADGSPSRP